MPSPTKARTTSLSTTTLACHTLCRACTDNATARDARKGRTVNGRESAAAAIACAARLAHASRWRTPIRKEQRTLARCPASGGQRRPACAQRRPAQRAPCMRPRRGSGLARPQLQQAQHHQRERAQQTRCQHAVIARIGMRTGVLRRRSVMRRGRVHGVVLRCAHARHRVVPGMHRCRSTSGLAGAHRLRQWQLAPAADQRRHQHQRNRQHGKRLQHAVVTERTEHPASVSRCIAAGDGRGRCATRCRTLHPRPPPAAIAWTGCGAHNPGTAMAYAWRLSL